MFANTLLVRGCFGAAAILLCHAAAHWTGAGYEFDIIAPNRQLDDFPMRFGEWKGADVPLETGTTDVLGSEAFINRDYKNAENEVVALHMAYWASPEYVADVAPHHPRVCYTGAGWEILEVRRLEIDTETGPLPLEVMLLQRNDAQVVTAHWYQMGTFRFTDKTDARGVHRQLWGKPQWPATLKVLLLLASADSIDSAIPTIEEVASSAVIWTAEF